MPTFDLRPVDEIPLSDAPLAKVLMQVQYSRTPGLVADDAEARLAAQLPKYPVRRQQLGAPLFTSLIVNGQPVSAGAPSTTLVFTDTDAVWQVTVSDTAVSLETTTYLSRDDFCARADEVFIALSAVAVPPVVDRVGLRYIDRLVGDRVERVREFFIPEVTALSNCVPSPLNLLHSVTDSLIAISETEHLQARSGLVPPGSGFDPSLPLVPEVSWLLDIDTYTVQAGFAFDHEELTGRLRRYAECAYAFFRVATRNAFHVAHGGDQPVPMEGEEA